MSALQLVVLLAVAHSGGVDGHSGKQGPTCGACHSGSAAAPTLLLSGPTALTAGQSYDYVVTLSGGPGVRAGLNVAAGPAAVTFLPDGTSTRTQAFELTHNTAQPFIAGQARFSFRMTAPSAPGALTLYAAGLSANGTSGNAGDTFTTRTLTVMVSAGNAPPTLPGAAAASPVNVTGTTTQLSALGADDGGEASLVYTWSASSGPAPVTFSVNGTNAAKGTTATFTRAGAYALSVTARDAQGLTATSSVTVTVEARAATVAVAPSNAGVAPGATQAFTATALDQFGQAVPATFTWTVGGGGTLSTAGVFTAGPTPGGPHTVTASAAGRSGTARVTVTMGAPPTFAQSPRAASANVTAASVAVAALGADDGGEGALTYTWEAAGVTFAPNGSNAAKSATASFTAPGVYRLTVTLRDAQGLTATASTSVTVSAAVQTLTVSPQTATVPPGGTLQLSAAMVDQFGGVPQPPPLLSWSVNGGGAVSSSGLFRAGSAPGGPFTVTASAQARLATAAITVGGSAAPTLVQPPSAFPTLVAGRSTTLHVLGGSSGAGGEAGLVYTWSASGGGPVSFGENATNAAKNSVAQFNAAGVHRLTVTLTDSTGASTTSSLEVTVQPSLFGIVVSPPVAEVKPGGAVQFRADPVDQFGAPLPQAPAMAWATGGGGAVDSSGLFTALQDKGPFTVSASAAGARGLAWVTVAAPAAPTAGLPATAPGRAEEVTGVWEGGCRAAPGLGSLLAALSLASPVTRRRRHAPRPPRGVR